MDNGRRPLLVLAIATGLVGCQAQLIGPEGSSSSSSTSTPPAMTPPGPGGPDAGTPGPGPSMPMPSTRADICGNGVDDDADGEVDEGCGCTTGTQQSCYQGPPGTGGLGICHPGIQDCVPNGEFPSWGPCTGSILPQTEIIENGKDDDCDGTTDEPDGICIPDEFGQETGDRCHDMHDNDCDGRRDCDDPSCLLDSGAACAGGCQPTEIVCYGGVDDDCDGAVDCDDAQCASDPACAPPLCPGGGSPVFRRRPPMTEAAGSYIAPGDGGAMMPMTCEGSPPVVCDRTTVAVETAPGSFACVPPPGECPAGLSPEWDSSGWVCTHGCELLIHYGGIYGFVTVCASSPDIACSGGLSPTFVYESESWECRPTCDNGQYDIHYVDGGLVCIPC